MRDDGRWRGGRCVYHEEDISLQSAWSGNSGWVIGLLGGSGSSVSARAEKGFGERKEGLTELKSAGVMLRTAWVVSSSEGGDRSEREGGGVGWEEVVGGLDGMEGGVEVWRGKEEGGGVVVEIG